MKTFKMILALATVAGLSACSSERKKTTEETSATNPPPATEMQYSAPVAPSQPAYTMANLGASSAGRSK